MDILPGQSPPKSPEQPGVAQPPQADTDFPYTENPGLKPMPKNPFAQKWWQLPKSMYLVLGITLLASLGSSAYLLLAPSGDKNDLSSLENAVEGVVSGKRVVTPSPTRGVILVDTPTPAIDADTQITPTPDVTVSWRTYNNFAYKYSFKYPIEWEVRDIGNLEPKVPSYVTVNPSSVTAPTTNLGITVSSSFRTFEEEQNLRSSARSLLTINGQNASRTEEQNSDGSVSIHIVVRGTSYTYILVGKKAYESTFNLLYPTFKLI